jgi:hypothetical protein
MKKRHLILFWLLLVLSGVLVSSWWISKRPPPAAQTECQKSPDTKVTIAGEVTKPQIVNLLHGTTLKQALDQAGGITPYSAPTRVKVYQNGQVYTINLKTKNDPALVEGSLIIASISQGMECQSHKNYIIRGRKNLSLAQLEKALAPQFDGTFVKNYWNGQENLDLRRDHKTSFRRFSIQSAKDPISYSSPEEQIFTYTITARPSRSDNPPTSDVRKFIDALSILVDGELKK